ncbi:hypothetical protein [Micromonospora mirobrigensis]|uniref:Uncharacterized protein n=1 Tax=Micromonospora mirobrigensis TaxID=262898 RepID=A0A1C5AGW4_9ACTN|nr:hypothetical protein [Micromonospora mirobrigensis]SCF44356.1 hypothetical protein GA0070564_11075 [Micromonospora mirobrigensis]
MSNRWIIDLGVHAPRVFLVVAVALAVVQIIMISASTDLTESLAGFGWGVPPNDFGGGSEESVLAI